MVLLVSSGDNSDDDIAIQKDMRVWEEGEKRAVGAVYICRLEEIAKQGKFGTEEWDGVTVEALMGM